MRRIETAAHVAIVDVMTGEGVLVLPDPERDLNGPGVVSLHAADWDAMVAQLDELGWEPSADDDGMPLSAGTLADGREVIGLFGREPLASSPSIDECAASVARMLVALST